MKNSSIIKYTFTYAELSSIFIVAFCCYFMTSIMSISPIYFTTLLGLYFLALQLHYKKSNIRITVYGAICAYGVMYLIDCLALESELHAAFVSFFFALYYIFADLALSQIDTKNKLKNILKIYFIFFVIYYFVDLILRLKTMQTSEIPLWMEVNPILKFYLIKEGGLNGDSNTIGTFCVAMFSVMFFSFQKGIIPKKYVYVTFIMTVLTASRAAIISCIALSLFWYFFYKKNTLIKIYLCFFGLCFAFVVFNVFLQDASFLTKLNIFEKTFDFIKESDMKTFMFGLGANNSSIVLGRYAHNIWSIMIIEYGLLGFLTFIVMMLMIMVDTGKYFFVVAIPYFLVSLSFTPIFLQFLFISFALTKYITKLVPWKKNTVRRKKHHLLNYFIKFNKP